MIYTTQAKATINALTIKQFFFDNTENCKIKELFAKLLTCIAFAC